MQKLIKRITRIGFILFFIELAGITAFFILYFLNLDPFITKILIIGDTAAVILNTLILWIFLANASKIRFNSDITAANIIGDDVQEVYSFAKVGLILTDESDTIIWVNDQFDDISNELIDRNIFTWNPKLEAFKDADNLNNVIHIDVKNRVYEVKRIKEANLYILKDITDFDAITEYSKRTAPVFGIVSIDNYQDLAAIVDEVKVNDMLAVAQKDITKYAKDFDLMVKKNRVDSYIIITNYEKYEKLLKDQFSILNKVKQDYQDDDNDLTLSIGFAIGTDDYIKLNELATDALDVALSRGGDQVVISPYGGNLIFVGGKTEAKSRKSRVRIRTISKSIETLVKDATEVLIMGHAQADLDAIGSAVGLYYFCKQIGKEVHIVYDDKSIESKTKKAFKSLFTKEEIQQMTITPSAAINSCTNKTLLILTDVHRPSITMAPNLVEAARKIAIIDHHRRGEEFVEKPTFSYIEPSSSSASELVTEIIRYSDLKMELPQNYATLMLSGILLDTNYYRVRTGSRTYDASAILKEFGADNVLADSFLKEEFEEYSLMVKIISTAVTPFTGVVVCKADESDVIDRTMLAKSANEMLSVKGVNACFVIGRIGQRTIGVSARSDGTVNVQLLIEKLGGGGHFSSAAVQFDGKKMDDVAKMLHDTLEYYLQDARTE